MYRDYIIFSTTGTGNGYAKIESTDSGLKVAIALRGYSSLKKDEVFKVFFVNKESPDLQHSLGSLDGGKGVLSINTTDTYDAVIIVRKNVNTGLLTMEFWGFRKGGEFDINTVILYEGNGEFVSKTASSSSTAYAQPEIEEQISEQNAINFNNESNNIENPKFKISDVLKKYAGGGFTWQRVNGYFSMFNYTIIQHILSSQLVYTNIMTCGYYLSGVKEDADCLYIAIVLPVHSNAQNPFQHVVEFSTIVANSDDTTYYGICIGIDSAGEFFCKVE